MTISEHRVTDPGGIVDLWSPPLQVLTADPQHGVSTYARFLAHEVRAMVPHTRLIDPGTILGEPTWLHLHFTDRLWGTDALSAAAAVEALAGQHRVIVTLHDVPQASDGTHLPSRAESYRRVIAAASGVVCNSRHEVELLREFIDPRVAAAVIPLPVHEPVAPAPPRLSAALDGSVAILGFVYPGKGHDRAIDAAARIATGGSRVPDVVALGRASAGHEVDVELLRKHGAARGVRFETTGYLSDAELLRRSRLVSVPLIAHDHVSASGSLASWISAGRRPIVLRSRYMEEMAALRPGTLTLVEPDDLAGAVAAALRNPASTWLAGDAQVRPTTRDTVEHYLDYWRAAMRGESA